MAGATTIASEVFTVASEVGQPLFAPIELVKPGKTVYAVLVDLCLVPGGALLFGSSKTPMRFTAGTWFNLSATPETKGLSLLHPIQVGSLDPFVRLTVFYQPVTDLDLRAAADATWACAQVFRARGLQAAGVGASAGILIGNWTPGAPPGFQLPPALANVAQFAERIMRVDSLSIESSSNGRVFLVFQGAQGVPQLADLTFAFPNPDPLGMSNRPGRCQVGQSAAFALVNPIVLMDVAVQAGIPTPIDDLLLPIIEGWACAVVDQTLNTTLRVNVSYRVMKRDPGAFDQ